MNETMVDAKIQAIEAALKLTEKRQLPALRGDVGLAPFPVRSESQPPAVRKDDLALALLWRMEQRVAEIEEKRVLDGAWQKTLDVTQGEHAEAIELIGKEVAALKKQAQKIERHLSAAQLAERQRRSRQYSWTDAAKIVLYGIALLGIVTFLVLAFR
jgi:hypothetical protein